MKAFALLASTLCLLCLPVYANNLLANPGFETGDFSNWTVVPNTPTYGVDVAGTDIPGAFFGSMLVIVNSGTYAAYAIVCNNFAGNCLVSGDPGDNLTISQTVDLVAGVTYHIGFWIGNPITTALGNSSDITVDGVSVSYANYPFDLVQGYTQVDGTFTPSSSGPASVAYFLQGSGSGDAGLSFDDFYVNSPVPEPSSLLLMGSGLLGAVGVLRRKLMV